MPFCRAGSVSHRTMVAAFLRLANSPGSPARAALEDPRVTVLLSVQACDERFRPSAPVQRPVSRPQCGSCIGLVGPNGLGSLRCSRCWPAVNCRMAEYAPWCEVCGSATCPRTSGFQVGQTVGDVPLAALADDGMDEHDRSTRTAITLTQLGFPDPDQPAANLSGGLRKRLAGPRAGCQLQLLLLDEPTNHLDLPSILWLQRLLRAAPFGDVVATHDRAFLRAVADEIVA